MELIEPVQIPGIEQPFAWRGTPEHVAVTGDGVTIVAGPRTDLFTDPAHGNATTSAPALLTALPDGDHQLTARVEVGFTAAFDAGVLLVWGSEERYAKLCFERSPASHPMIVTVVTRGTSDDANAYTVEGDRWWLRISTLGATFAFHASADGERWDLIRYFDLGAGERPAVGFEAQSPTGEGCEVTFDRLALTANTLPDLRGGI